MLNHTLYSVFVSSVGGIVGGIVAAVVVVVIVIIIIVVVIILVYRRGELILLSRNKYRHMVCQ